MTDLVLETQVLPGDYEEAMTLFNRLTYARHKALNEKCIDTAIKHAVIAMEAANELLVLISKRSQAQGGAGYAIDPIH